MVQAPHPLWAFSNSACPGSRRQNPAGPQSWLPLRRLKQRAGSGGAASACRVFLPGKRRAAGVGLLLRGGEKIGDVAVAVGYENSPHFSRAFKKFYGVSPKQYQSLGQDST